LCQEAEYLIRLINRLRPEDAEIEGALAMMLLTAARRAARIGQDGASLPPAAQDRSLWDHSRIEEGREILTQAMHRRKPGPFQIKAAIADCQMAEPAPDWPQIALLYQSLLRHEPTAVVTLNAAVAAAEAGEADKALLVVESLAEQLSDYQPWHAARAALLVKTGNRNDAIDAYQTAISSAPSPADALFLQRKLEALA
jgi:predicted RNA polymerase sigma factor